MIRTNLHLLGATYVSFFFLCASGKAQSNPLADTIWDGNAEITIPKLVWKNERPKFNRVETVSNIKFQVPVQLWFWGKDDSPSNAMSICFNQKKVGADPLRAELTMVLGQLPSWAIAQLEQIHARRPRKDDAIYLRPGSQGTYNLRAGTFRVNNNDTLDPQDPPTTEYVLEGKLSMAGGMLKKVSFVATQPTDLSQMQNAGLEASLISLQGNITGTVLNISKSIAKPSDQAAAQFSKFFDLQDQSP